MAALIHAAWRAVQPEELSVALKAKFPLRTHLCSKTDTDPTLPARHHAAAMAGASVRSGELPCSLVFLKLLESARTG